MKRLSKLSATNLKGRTFSHDLAEVNIIIGRNASGKTAELLAIELALLGYSRKLGRTSTGIFAACGCPGGGATELAVGSEFSDGTAIKRQWTMKRGKISYEGPDTEAIPPVMLDPTTYFALTGPARLNYVLSQVNLGALGLGCEALLNKLTIELPQTVTNETRCARDEVSSLVTKLEVTRDNEDASIYEWMTAVVEDLTELAKTAKAQADTHEQTLRGLTDGKAQDGDMSAIESVQPQINDARDLHTAAVQSERDALNAFTEAERKVQEAKTLAHRRVDENEMRSQIDLQEQQIDKAKLVPAPGERPVAKQMETVRPNCAGELANRNVMQSHVDSAVRAERQASAIMDGLQAAMNLAESQTNCPTCGHDISDKQKLVIADLKARLTAAQESFRAAVGTAAHNLKAHGIAESTYQAVLVNIQQWDTAAEALRRANQSALDAWDTLHRAHTTAQTAINTATARISVIRQQLAQNAQAQEAWAGLPALELASKTAGEAYSAATAALPPIAEEIRQLEARQRQFVARTQDARRADQSREAARTANERLAVFKAALKVVAAEKERASEDAFKMILKHTRKFTDGILKAPLEYRDGELGMNQGGNWCSYKTFSGSEELLAFAGLGVALTQQHQGTKVVMMDELGRLDASTKANLIGRMMQLTSNGTIDTFVGADVSDLGYVEINDVKLIYVDKIELPLPVGFTQWLDTGASPA